MIDDTGYQAATSSPDRTKLVAALIFFQMLPATMLSPAIRPMFAQHYAGNEGLMHAFMAVNMCGAVLFVPWLAARADRMRDARLLVASLVAADSSLLFALASGAPAFSLLGIRMFEGVAHVSVTSMLLSEMTRLSPPAQRARAMGMAGAALMFAVALGSALGGTLVPLDARLPFWAGSAIQAGVFVAVRRLGIGLWDSDERARQPWGKDFFATLRPLLVPFFAVFVGRFTVGCLVVTFALFAHRAHGISDRSVGLLFSLVTLPFALTMYPCARLAERVPRSLLLVVGAAVHASALLSLGRVATPWLSAVMIVMGVASALLFSPTLCYAGERAEVGRQKRMALLNVAGCLGMVVGPMAAGITAAVVGRVDPVAGYRAVFALAGSSVIVWLLASLPWLVRRARAEHVTLRAHALQHSRQF